MHGSPKLSLLTHITLLRPYYFVLLGFTSYLHKYIKFTFSEKATKTYKIFTVNLTVCSNRQIDGEDFITLCGLLRKHELKN